MYQSILIPLDGSRFSEAALPTARQLARLAHARVRVVRVHQQVPAFVAGADGPVPVDLGDEVREDAEETYLETISDLLRQSGLCNVESVVAHGVAGPAICDEVERCNADLVVISTHGRGAIGRFILGSVARYVVHHAGVPVLLVCPGVELETQVGQSILVATDLQPESAPLVEHVTAMAHLLGAHLHFLHVVVPSPMMPSVFPSAEGGLGARENAATVALARERLDRLVTGIRDKGGSASAEVVIDLTPAAGVLGELKARPYAMVAVCAQQAGLARRIFLGSTASRVIHESTVPVFVFDPSGPDVS